MVQLQPGDALIYQNPHPLFDRLSAKARRLFYGWETDGNGDKVLTVQATCGEAVIGAATFAYCGTHPFCQNVRVEEAHRRQGVANAIYVFAEVVMGTHLEDYWGEHAGEGDEGAIQSKEGRRLWRQSQRPFGNPGFIAGRPKQSTPS